FPRVRRPAPGQRTSYLRPFGPQARTGGTTALPQPLERVGSFGSSAGRKSRNSARPPEQARVLAGVDPARERAICLPRTRVMRRYADRFWGRLSISPALAR